MKVLLTVLFLSLIIFSCNNEPDDVPKSVKRDGIKRNVDGDYYDSSRNLTVGSGYDGWSQIDTSKGNEYFMVSDTTGEIVAIKTDGKWDIPDCEKALETVEYLHIKNWQEQKALQETIYILTNKIKQYEENLRNNNVRHTRN